MTEAFRHGKSLVHLKKGMLLSLTLVFDIKKNRFAYLAQGCTGKFLTKRQFFGPFVSRQTSIAVGVYFFDG